MDNVLVRDAGSGCAALELWVQMPLTGTKVLGKITVSQWLVSASADSLLFIPYKLKGDQVHECCIVSH